MVGTGRQPAAPQMILAKLLLSDTFAKIMRDWTNN